MAGRFHQAFRFGFTSSLLTWATLNALSYFVRSDGWGNLLGTRPDGVEAIGCPWIVWGEGGRFAGHFISTAAMLGDTLVAIGTSLAIGLAAAWFSKKRDLTGTGQTTRPAPPPEARRQFQFSLRSMLLGTTAVAFVLSMVRADVDTLAILLLVVYLFGPSMLLIVAHGSRRIVPVQRHGLLCLVGFLLIAAAAGLGEAIQGIHDFTQGVLGLFVCWIPQCLFILVVMLAWQQGRAKEGDTPCRSTNGHDS